MKASPPELSSDDLWVLLHNHKVEGLKDDESYWPLSTLSTCLTPEVVSRSLTVPEGPKKVLGDGKTQTPSTDGNGISALIKWLVEDDTRGGAFSDLDLKAEFVAVKKLRGGREDKFRQAQREADQLRLFDGQLHPHLVTLLATYEIEGEYFFLFPFAEYDLQDLWDKEAQPKDMQDAATVRWLSRQICGLVGAMAQIHEPRKIAPGKYGRHGDIKPDNILCYRTHRSYGWHLVISDLGVSALNSENSRSNVPGEAISEIPEYRPPECDVRGGSINRLFDVWTMGCLIFEMLAQVVGGRTLRDEFDHKRTTFFMIGGGRKNVFYDLVELEGGSFRQSVKAEVLQCFDTLRADDRSSQYIRDVLTVIEDQMMVILRKDRTLVRSTSNELVKIFDHLHDKCQRDEEYCVSQSNPSFPNANREPIAVLVELNKRSLSQLQRWPVQKRSGRERVSMDASKMKELDLVNPRDGTAGEQLGIPGHRPRRRESARTHGRVGARASTLRDLVSTCVTPSKEKKCGKKRVVEEESFEDFPALDFSSTRPNMQGRRSL
ncbi:kinase domain-containing protein [Verticillium dahliae]|nr:kinase domain-containing protein [Verticillium dahliae]